MFQLSVASLEGPTSSTSGTITELISVYENEFGNIGFGFARNDPDTHVLRNQFPDIFINTKEFMDKPVQAYVSVKSVMGRAFQ